MIAPRNYLPLLEDKSGEVRAIETDWLLAALERAAVKAGFMEWWLADHVISSVFNYLSGCYTSNVVAVGRLQAAVRQALRDVGYVEIAQHFEAESPVDRCSLLQCAQALPGFEMHIFYLALERQVREWHASRLTTFYFQEMSPCLRYIKGSTGYQTNLQTEDLVATIRSLVASLPWEREVRCSIT